MDQFPKHVRPFHPKDPAYGTLNYDIGALDERQKRNLNLRKMNEKNENEIYLRTHQEIKGLISILLRYVLRRQPLMDLHETMGEFFNRPRQQIVVDLLEYFLHPAQEFTFENEFQVYTNAQTDYAKVSCCNK